MRIGSLTVRPVRDGRVVAPAAALYRAVPEERWSRWSRTLDNGGVIVELGGYLVQGFGFNALVDAGFGPAWAPNGHAGLLLDSLAEFGLDPGDITDVIFTHLHFDHVGWASNDGTPTFPNATYRAASADWSYFVRESHELTALEATLPGDRLPATRLSPIADRVVLWGGRTEMRPGVTAIPTPGHTPGTALIELSSEGETGYLLGDVVHHPAELVNPDWPGVADVDGGGAAEQRRAVAAMLANTGALAAGAHFAGFEWGRVVPSSGQLEWEPVETL